MDKTKLISYSMAISFSTLFIMVICFWLTSPPSPPSQAVVDLVSSLEDETLWKHTRCGKPGNSLSRNVALVRKDGIITIFPEWYYATVCKKSSHLNDDDHYINTLTFTEASLVNKAAYKLIKKMEDSAMSSKSSKKE